MEFTVNSKVKEEKELFKIFWKNKVEFCLQLMLFREELILNTYIILSKLILQKTQIIIFTELAELQELIVQEQ